MTPNAATVPASNTVSSATTATPDVQTLSLTARQLRTVQRHVGVTADGKLDYATRGALKRYQRRHHLTVTGRVDLQTLRALKLGLAEVFQAKLEASEAASASSLGGVTASTTLSTPAPTAAASKAIAAATAQIGTKYVSGGQAPGGFDCSGLVMWAYKQAGVNLPRTSFEQYTVGTPVAKADIQPGDLVFFDSGGAGASHVGIAISATTAISATLHGVMIHQIFDSYWGSYYVGARRISD